MSQAATAGSARRASPKRPSAAAGISRALLRPILMLGGILVVAVGVRRLLAHRRALRLDRRRLCARRQGDDRHRRVRHRGLGPGARGPAGQEGRRAAAARSAASSRSRSTAPRANLRRHRDSTLNAMKLDYQRMLRDVEVKQAQVQADQANFDRYRQPGEVAAASPAPITTICASSSPPTSRR